MFTHFVNNTQQYLSTQISGIVAIASVIGAVLMAKTALNKYAKLDLIRFGDLADKLKKTVLDTAKKEIDYLNTIEHKD